MKTKKTMKHEGFPQVWKNPTGYVTIIYSNHSETYKLVGKYNDTIAKKVNNSNYNPYNEIEMEKGNGSRRVHGKKTVKVIDFTR